MRKHFVLLLALVLCIGLLSGCSAKQTSYSHQELTIRLPETYLDLSQESYAKDWDFLYGLAPVTVSGLRDEKTRFEAFDLDLESYGKLMLEVNGVDSAITEEKGIPTFTYEAGGYTYVVTLWETEDAYWTVQAYCPTEDFASAKDQMWEILTSVKLS